MTRNRGIVVFACIVGLLLVDVVTANAICVGDCNDSGDVKVDELVTSVRIALELSPLSQCEAIETNDDGKATVNELVTAVNNALHGCAIAPTPTPDLGNKAPQVDAGDDVTTAIDQPPTLTGSATDDGLPSPPAALTFSWSKVSGPGSVTFGSASAATTTATFSAVGSYVLRLTANDGARSGSDEVTVHVDISAANVAPTLDPVANQTIIAGSALNLGLVGHDDNPFDALSYGLVAGPEGARVATNGIFSFAPLAAQLGAHAVTVRVQDQAGLMAETSFDVTVIAGNRAPSFDALADDITPLAVAYAKTLTATDPDAGDTLSFTLLSGPPGMTLTGAQLAWTPAANQFGTHIVSVTVSDGRGGDSQAEFRIVVPSPAAPTARDDAYEVVIGQTLSVPAPGVSANDTSVDGSAITTTQLTQPDKGSVTAFTADGAFTYVAPPGLPPPPPLDAAPRFQRYDFGVLTGSYPPLVANVDGIGAPEIISWIGDELHVVHGDTGEELFAATSLPPPYEGCAMYGRGYDSFAVGDVDDDGTVEIVMNAQCAADNPSYLYVAGNATRVIALAYDDAAPAKFRVKWITDPFSPRVPILPEQGGDGHLYVPFGGQAAYVAFTIARLRPTEKPTILFGKSYAGFGGQFSNCGKVLPGKIDPYCRFVFAVDGDTGAQRPLYYATPDDPSSVEVYGEGAFGAPAAPVVADVDDDGELDVLYQGTLWNLDGSVKRQFDGTRATGLASSDSIVLDLDGDPDMEIVTIDNANYRRAGYVKAWKPDGRLLWSLTIPGSTVVTRLSAGDVDRSGRPTILFAIYDTLWAVDHTGHVKWLATVPPLLGFIAPVNGPGHDFRIYDLNGDGLVEIVWQVSKQTILFLRGDTGEVQTSTSYPNQPESGAQSNTSPIIADVDGSGQANMVWYHDVNFNGTTLLQVYRGDTAPWRQVAPQFNQRVYWGTNFNPDGTVPLTYPRHTTDAATNLVNQQPPLPYSVEPRLRTETTFTYAAQHGPLASAPATVTIGILPENRAPVITALPSATSPEGNYRSNPITFQLAATDPDVGDTITFALTYRGCGEEGRVTISPSGLFSFADGTPNETLCWYEVRASDNHGAFSDKPFSIFFTSETRTVPDVIGLNRSAALAALTAADLGLGALAEVPNPAPPGQVLTQSPLHNTEVPRGTLVQLSISAGPAPEDRDDDGDGFTENQGDCDDSDAAFSPGAAEVPDNGIDENCDGSERIVASIVVTPASALRVTGEQVPYSATAVYIDGTSADVTTTANWSAAPSTIATIDAAGTARAVDIGNATITATFGGAVGRAALTVDDRKAGDQDDPTARITTPASGASLTGLTQVTGTATDANFLRYELAVALASDMNFKFIGAGTAPVVDGVLGTLDPTMLVNDIYALRLTVWDANGNQANAEICVQVAGNQKVGNFTLAFTDLSIDLAGIPIDLTRSYDSRDARHGDFGIGWRLRLDTLRLSMNRVLGTGWEVIKPGLAYALRATDGHFVSLTLPDGRVEQFDLQMTPSVSTLVPFSFMQATFVPRPGTLGTIAALDNSNLLIADPQPGEVVLLDDSTLNTYNPQRFRYTAVTGEQIVISRLAGVESITDRNGNTLTYGPNGITNSAGVGLAFERDLLGRITRITDPTGAMLHYAYDANGDLRSYTDAAGGITRYSYNLDHGLLDIIDPRGIRGVRNEYDDEGRLLATIDADGARIEFSYDTVARREVVTDRLGHLTIHEYDNDGNVTATTDALGQRTEYTYDSQGHELTKTDALGRIQSKTYDAAGNVLSTTDVDGNLTTATYNSGNQLLSDTSALGTTTRVYDAQGNLTQTTDPDGRVIGQSYDPAGKVLTITAPGGKQSTYTYDASGHRVSLRDVANNVHTFTNDAAGHRLSETRIRSLPAGGTEEQTTTFAYNALGKLTTTTDPAGGQSTVEYDAGGRQIAFTNRNGHRTESEYDARGLLVRSGFADGSSETFGRDAEGRQITTTDRDGMTTTYQYDALGRLIRTLNPDGTGTSRTYDPVGRVLTETDERGNTTTHAYAANQETVTDALGHVTVHRFDAIGRRIAVIDALQRTTTFTYDSRSNLTGITFADASTYSITYDPTGRYKTSEVDQAGRVSRYAYDALGRLIAFTDAADGVTRYAYDEVGNLIAQTDAADRITTMEYDARGFLIKRTRPLGQFETFTYDADGNVLSHRDFNGDTTTFAYDANDRLIRKTLPDDTVIEYAYTPSGRRTRAGTATYRYDARGRLLAEIKENGAVISYAYDAAGNRTLVKTPYGTTAYTYDQLNRLATVVDATGTTTYTYDAVGNRAGERLPNGVMASYAYDALNRLIAVTNTGPGGIISSYAYTLAPAGNRVAVVEAGSSTTGRSVTYDYDDLYRLTRETVDEPGTAADRAVTYTYDAVGNRLAKTERLGAQITSVTYTYDDNDRLTMEDRDTATAQLPRNVAGPQLAITSVALSPIVGLLIIPMTGRHRRLGRRARRRRYERGIVATILVATTICAPAIGHALALQGLRPASGSPQTSTAATLAYSYDDNGNLLTRSDGTRSDTYTFDFENRLISADTHVDAPGGLIAYTYDADGIRTSKTVDGETTTYLTDKNLPFAQVLAEDVAGSVTRYSYALDRISMTRPAGGVRFYERDGSYSTRQLTDAAGTATDAYTYDAFGLLLERSGNTSNDFLYSGEQLDANVGFYYLRARYYAQGVGRFISTDPFRGSIFDPVSLHRYLYANADPINVRDPSGAVSIAAIQVTALIVGVIVAVAGIVAFGPVKGIALGVAAAASVPVGFAILSTVPLEGVAIAGFGARISAFFLATFPFLQQFFPQGTATLNQLLGRADPNLVNQVANIASNPVLEEEAAVQTPNFAESFGQSASVVIGFLTLGYLGNRRGFTTSSSSADLQSLSDQVPELSALVGPSNSPDARRKLLTAYNSLITMGALTADPELQAAADLGALYIARGAGS